MKRSRLSIAVTIILFYFPNLNFAQAPNLGTAADFVLFTTTGAVGNTGVSQVTGNIGTNNGAITGFGNVNGKLHNTDAVTALCATDLLSAYNQLNSMVPTFFPGTLLGSGQVFNKGVYNVPSAASLNGCLILDAQGNPNAVFVFQIQGAFSTAASSKICLINGALACNVFWKVEGAVSMATGTFMRGSIIANNGAISIGATDTLEGRALSTTGSVTIYGTLAYMPLGCGVPMLTGASSPTLSSADAYALFASNASVFNTGSTYINGDVGSNSGTTLGYNPVNVTGTIHLIPDGSTASCSVDLLTAYSYINALPFDIELLYPLQFGNNLTLTPHTYLLNSNTVLTDTLYLDGEGNSNGIFVFQVNGSFSTSVFSKVKLINKAQSTNVYWKIEGPVIINNNSVFKGTIICNSGSITFNTGARLYGRALATSGPINTNSTTITILNDTSSKISVTSACVCLFGLPVELLSFACLCDNQHTRLKWSTAAETNIAYFTAEYSLNGINWQALGLTDAVANSHNIQNYSFMDTLHINQTQYGYYRLKETDHTGFFQYTSIESIIGCTKEEVGTFQIYPNPSTGKFAFVLNTGSPNLINIDNVLGESVLRSASVDSGFDLSGNSPGIYFVTIYSDSKTINRKIIVEN